MAYPRSGSSFTVSCRIGILIFVEGGKPDWEPAKYPRSGDQNHQQTQPTDGVTAPECEPGHHWHKASALTTTPPLLHGGWSGKRRRRKGIGEHFLFLSPTYTRLLFLGRETLFCGCAAFSQSKFGFCDRKLHFPFHLGPTGKLRLQSERSTPEGRSFRLVTESGLRFLFHLNKLGSRFVSRDEESGFQVPGSYRDRWFVLNWKLQSGLT